MNQKKAKAIRRASHKIYDGLYDRTPGIWSRIWTFTKKYIIGLNVRELRKVRFAQLNRSIKKERKRQEAV